MDDRDAILPRPFSCHNVGRELGMDKLDLFLSFIYLHRLVLVCRRLFGSGLNSGWEG